MILEILLLIGFLGVLALYLRSVFCIRRYHILLEGLQDGILLWDRKRNGVICTKKARRYLDSMGLKRMQEIVDVNGRDRSTLKEEQVSVTVIPCNQQWWVVFSEDMTDGERLDQGKYFIANACHELRTPITIIKGFTETLQEMPQITDEMQKLVLEKIQRNCSRLENVVTHSLVLADLDRTAPLLDTKCDLVSIVDKCCQTLISLHPECHIEHFHREDAIEVLGEAHLLELAIMNVLQNSVKYSEGPAQIVVYLDQTEGQISLSITDKGMGIPKDEVEHIFDRFYKVRTPQTAQSGGAGLGLSIVQKVIDRHKATIACDSTEGQGTTIQMLFKGGVVV